jgi:hypothetical protein
LGVPGFKNSALRSLLAKFEKSNMAWIPADSFPRCSDIMRLLNGGATESEARRSTENPECVGSRRARKIEAVVVLGVG